MNPTQPTPNNPTPPAVAQNSASVGMTPVIVGTSQGSNSVITPGVPEIGSLEAAPAPAASAAIPSPVPILNESIYAVAPEPPIAQPKKISWAPGIPKLSFAVVGFVIVSCAAATLYVMNRHANTPQTQVNNQEPSSNTLGNVSAESVTFGIDTKIANGKKLTASGPVIFKNDSNSASAFSVQDASGASLINVDTKTGTVTINGKLNAANLVSPSTQLGANITQAGNSFNGASQLVQLGSSGILPALNGSALIAINASNISSGTLSDARLSSNVSLKNANNNLFKPGTDSTNTFQIQNSTGTATLFIADTFNRRVAINQAAANYTLDVNGDINVTAGGSIRINGVALCSGAGCTAASGSGSYIQNRTSIQSANFAVQSADSNSVAGLLRGASGQVANIFQVNDGFNDTVFSVGATGNVLIQPSADSTNAFWVQNAAGTSHLIGGDTVNDRVAIALPTPPTYTLDVGGDINSTTAIRVGGNIICSAGGCTPGAGSGNYIQNSTSLQTANFAIQSDANNHIVATIRGASGQTADLFDLVAGDSGQKVATVGARGDATFQNATDSTTAFRVKNAAGSNLLNVSSSGAALTANTSALFQNASDSTSAFQIQNAAGTSNLLVADTIDSKIGIGTASPVATFSIKDNFSSPSLSANLTVSGGEITDASRATNTQGDGLTPPDSSYGAWEGTTNLLANGGFESGTTGWNPVSSSVNWSASAKFGSHSAQIVTNNSTANEGSYTTFVQGSNQKHTVSIWAKASTGSPTVRLRLADNTPTTIATGLPVTLSNTWTRLTLTTSTSLGSGTYRVYIETDVQQSATFYVDGAQAEARPYPTPYVETNGTTQSRIASNITAPATLLGQSQGWIAIRFRMDIPPGNVGDLATFSWTDGTNSALMRIHGGGGGPTSDVRFGVNSALALKSNVDITQTNLYTMIATWTNSQIGISVNGSSFSTAAISGMPTISSPTFTIAGSGADSDVFWSAAGTGTLTNTDASTINGYGNTDPTLTSLSDTLLTGRPTMAWDANSATYHYQTGISNPIAFQVQDASAANLITVNANSDAGSVLVVGTNTTTSTGGISFGTDTTLYRSGTGALTISNSSGGDGTLQAAVAVGADAIGSNLILAGGKGTGVGNGGNINLQIAKPSNNTNQSFITGSSTTRAVAVNGSFIYWLNAGASNSIGRANLDGTGVNNSFITGLNNPTSIAIDSGHIYWTNINSGAIGRANLDGTGVNQSFITGATNTIGIAVDGSYIYWGNNNSIGRANLDGTGANFSFMTGVVNVNGLAVDSGHIYWDNDSGGGNSIGRANIDGTGANNNFITGVSGGEGVAVDNSHIYWGNNTAGTIGRANLDGTGINQSFLSGATGPYGVALDSSDVYWSNSTLNTVARFSVGSTPNNLSTVASLSGSNGSALFQNAVNSSTAFQIQNASGTALFVANTSAMTITISGALTVTGNITVNGLLNVSASGIHFNDGSVQTTAANAATYVNSLPGSPTNGQEIYFIADAPNGVIWHLRYDSTLRSGAGAWAFLGGSALDSEVTTGDDQVVGTTYQDLATSGPSLTLPLSGTYDISIGAELHGESGTGAMSDEPVPVMSYAIGGTGASDADAIYGVPIATGVQYGQSSVARTERKSGLGAVTLTTKYRRIGGSNSPRVSAQNRYLRATPVYVY